MNQKVFSDASLSTHSFRSGSWQILVLLYIAGWKETLRFSRLLVLAFSICREFSHWNQFSSLCMAFMKRVSFIYAFILCWLSVGVREEPSVSCVMFKPEQFLSLAKLRITLTSFFVLIFMSSALFEIRRSWKLLHVMPEFIPFGIHHPHERLAILEWQ